jgi:hypothetical protein
LQLQTLLFIFLFCIGGVAPPTRVQPVQDEVAAVAVANGAPRGGGGGGGAGPPTRPPTPVQAIAAE